MVKDFSRLRCLNGLFSLAKFILFEEFPFLAPNTTWKPPISYSGTSPPSVGKTGVNEQQQAYAVTGIGISKAARIAYRAERLYLTPNSDYRSARVFTIQAATDLLGANSAEVTAVIDA